MRCEYEFVEDGITWRCKNETSGAIMRCKDVCGTHKTRLYEDNKRRHNKGIDIPNSFEMLKPDKSTLRLLVNDNGVNYADYQKTKKKNKYAGDKQVIISDKKLDIKEINTTKLIKA